MKKSICMLILSFILYFPISCGDDCGNVSPISFEIQALGGEVGAFTDFVFMEQAATNFSDFALKIGITAAEQVATLERPSTGFVNRVYACSPPQPAIANPLESILVTSDRPVYSGGEIYEEGSSLNDLFHVTNGRTEIPMDELKSYINTYNELFLNEGQFLIFQLIDRPDSIMNQSFQFEFIFSDREIHVETDEVVVTN